MKVGFIGFGNMAQALAEGFAATGALKPCQIGACARDRAKLRRNTEPKGFLAFDDAARVAEFADMVIVAVKPHQVEAVLSPVKELLAGKIVVSVAAGMTFGKYETILAPERTISVRFPTRRSPSARESLSANASTRSPMPSGKRRSGCFRTSGW